MGKLEQVEFYPAYPGDKITVVSHHGVSHHFRKPKGLAILETDEGGVITKIGVVNQKGRILPFRHHQSLRVIGPAYHPTLREIKDA